MGMNQTDARILLTFACDLMAVDMPTLAFTPQTEADKSVAGRYYPEQHILFMNLGFGDKPLQIFTLFHEARHHYQYTIVDTNDTELEAPETISRWRNEIQHYIPADVDQFGHDSLSIEVDADAFALIMILYIWGVAAEPHGRTYGEDALVLRCREIADEYTFAEAKQIIMAHNAANINWTTLAN